VCEGSAASDHRIPPQTLSAFLGTQLSETGRHGSCTDAYVDRFEVCVMLSQAIPHFLWVTVAQTSVTLARMVPRVTGVRTCGLLPSLFLPVTFPVARNCSTVFTVFVAGASLHLYWFLNRRWTVTIEFVCRNHYTIRVSCSVISGGAILNDVTASSAAKYGKNTNV